MNNLEQGRNYDEVRSRIKDFYNSFQAQNFVFPEKYWQMDEGLYQKIKEFSIHESRKLSDQYKNSLLSPILDGDQGLIAHIDCMTSIFEKLWEFDNFRKLFPEGTTFSFVKFLVLAHDYSRFIFNGHFPITYVDWVGDALNERRFFPEVNFDPYLHSIRYITGEKDMPDPGKYPLIYIFKAVDSLGKRGRNPEDFFGPSYDQWLQKQIESGRFPIRVRKDGKIIEISAQEYKKNDQFMIKKGLEIINKITGVSFEEILKSINSH
ncbi:MAG: hypothetical protein ACPLRN_03370 [Microgenomates group bacterium]